jgi:phage gpG-like protein
MVADIKIKANTIEVVNYLKKLQKTIPRDITKALNVVSAYGVKQIEEKTRRNEMPDGGRFKDYSQQYKNSKAYASKENKSVDLYLSGKMFSSLTWKVSGSKGSLFFRRQTENIKAFKHDQGIGKLPKRPFFAIGKQDENKIRDLFFKHIKV